MGVPGLAGRQGRRKCRGSAVGSKAHSGKRSAVTLGVTVPQMDHSLDGPCRAALGTTQARRFTTRRRRRARRRGPFTLSHAMPAHPAPHRTAPHRTALIACSMDGMDSTPPAALHTVAHTYCAQTIQYSAVQCSAVWSSLRTISAPLSISAPRAAAVPVCTLMLTPSSAAHCGLWPKASVASLEHGMDEMERFKKHRNGPTDRSIGPFAAALDWQCYCARVGATACSGWARASI
jgi:hypothetical protein